MTSQPAHELGGLTTQIDGTFLVSSLMYFQLFLVLDGENFEAADDARSLVVIDVRRLKT